MRCFIRHVNPQPVNALLEQAGRKFWFLEPSKVKPCCTECFMRTSVTPLHVCAPLSRRRPGELAWRAACVKTTTRSGSCFISSTLWCSCCCRKRTTLTDFPQRSWIRQLQLFERNPVHVPFYIYFCLHRRLEDGANRMDGWMGRLICVNRLSYSWY